jgi:hypothetical protein
MNKIVTAVLISAAMSGPAQAWGDREQGALAGAAAVLLFQHVQRAQAQPYPNGQPPVVVGQQPVIVAQPYPAVRQYCFPRPVLWDPYSGRPTHYATECRTW